MCKRNVFQNLRKLFQVGKMLMVGVSSLFTNKNNMDETETEVPVETPAEEDVAPTEEVPAESSPVASTVFPAGTVVVQDGGTYHI